MFSGRFYGARKLEKFKEFVYWKAKQPFKPPKNVHLDINGDVYIITVGQLNQIKH